MPHKLKQFFNKLNSSVIWAVITPIQSICIDVATTAGRSIVKPP